jgi:hypothetical protein
MRFTQDQRPSPGLRGTFLVVSERPPVSAGDYLDAGTAAAGLGGRDYHLAQHALF